MKIIEQKKGGVGCIMHQNSLSKNQNGNLLHTLVFSRVFYCSDLISELMR